MLAELAGLGLTIGGTLFGMNKAGDAAKRAQQAALLAAQQQGEGLNNAINERRSGLGTTLGYLSPYEQNGRAGMGLLSDALGVNGGDAQRGYFANFQNDPGFNATLKAGTNSIEQSQAGGGLLRSGGTLKSLQDYGMRLQGAAFSDRMNRLTGLGQQGQQAAGAMAGFNNSASSDVSSYFRDIGDANAGGTLRASNADQRGTQNQLSMLAFGMGQAKSPLNDLFGGMGGSSFGSQAGGYLNYGTNPFATDGSRNPYYGRG